MGITTAAGSTVKSAKKIANGLFVETVHDAQPRKFLNINKIGGIYITVIPHGKIKLFDGVIICKNLLNCSEQGLVEELLLSGSYCKPLSTRKNGRLNLPPLTL